MTAVGMGGHQSARMNTDVWLTPPELLEQLGVFDLDPCAAPAPRPWPTAAEHIALPRDGLIEPWHGRVWLNPPYGKYTHLWMKRLAEHNHGTALIFARTETTMFRETVWRHASAVKFLSGRLHFHHASGERALSNSGAPSCLVAFGDYDAERLMYDNDLAGFAVNSWTESA